IADDINDVKISDMYDTSSNSIFESLPEDTTIGNLPDKVTQIKIVDVFSGDIWPDGVDHTEDNAVAIWKYMLIDSTGTFNTSYLLCDDMDQLTDNVTRNVNKASIGDLVNDGFITLSDTSVLSKPDPSGSGKTVGELTFAEFLEAYGSL
nr:hypothetical protein [Bacilli bacterium]